MTTWTTRIPISFPTNLFGTPEATLTLINRLAQIIDPDTGGALTFAADRITNGYFTAESQLLEHFVPVVEGDAEVWQQAIAALAAEKGVEPPTPEEIATLRAGALIGDAARAALGLSAEDLDALFEQAATL